MRDVLSLLGYAVAFLAILAGAAAVLAVIFFWWYGIIAGFQSFGIPMIVSFIGMAIAFFSFPKIAAPILAIFGLYAGIVILEWHWFLTTALYATTLTLLFTTMVIGAIISVFAFVLETLSSISTRRGR